MAGKKSTTITNDAPYTGLLARPLPFVPPGLDANKPPRWFEGSEEDWLQRVHDLKEDRARRFVACLDLVCVHHGVDIRSENLGWDLAFALLEAHVPAFNDRASVEEYTARRKTSRGQPTRLDASGTIGLIHEWAKLRNAARGHKVSERQLGHKLSKLPQFEARGLDEETIRKLLAQLRRAWPDYKRGRATEFQIQYIEDVAPLIWNQGKDPGRSNEGGETSSSSSHS